VGGWFYEWIGLRKGPKVFEVKEDGKRSTYRVSSKEQVDIYFYNFRLCLVTQKDRYHQEWSFTFSIKPKLRLCTDG
jgi:hypothetical protein